MNIEYTLVRELKPYANNARTHSRKQVRQIANSIKRFGFNNPVLIDDKNQIVAGHGRVEAAKLLGLHATPSNVCWRDFSCSSLRHLCNNSRPGRRAEHSFARSAPRRSSIGHRAGPTPSQRAEAGRSERSSYSATDRAVRRPRLLPSLRTRLAQAGGTHRADCLAQEPQGLLQHLSFPYFNIYGIIMQLSNQMPLSPAKPGHLKHSSLLMGALASADAPSEHVTRRAG